MVDLVQLASDILQADSYFLIPPALWLFLFLLAWEDPELARRTGFGRTTFWLLLPGAIVGSISDLPIFGWEGAILAVNLGGGLIPVVLSVVLFRETVGQPPAATVALLGALAAESAAMFVSLLVLPAGRWTDVALLVAGAVVPIGVALIGRRGAPSGAPYVGRTAAFLGLVSGVLLATYASTATVPQLGIISQFPYYLIGPVASGALAVLLAPRLLGLPAHAGMPLGYAAATLGVLFGADLLRQPPLYGSGAAIYAIGGAGVIDLVYLSGLLALGTAFLTYRWTGPYPLQGAPSPPPEPSPTARLRIALQLGLAGRSSDAISAAQGSARAAADQARLLTGVPSPPPGASPWAGLPVASWVVADHRNLDSLAGSGRRDPRDAYRAWVMARALVRAGVEAGRRRLGTLGARSGAFLVDLAILATPSVVLWVYLARTMTGRVTHILGTPLFNAAAIALAGYGFLYFVIAESGWGTTPGKTAFGLRVTDRTLGPPRLVNVMVRDLPKLIPMSVVGVGGSLFVLAAIRGPGAFAVSGPPIFALSALVLLAVFVALGVAISGAVSVLAIHESAEGQRLGDLVAGTWVVRSGPTTAAATAPAPAGAAGSSG